MALADAQLIVLSVPTSADGATAAATFTFATQDYRIPRQERALGSDTIQNQNGMFHYVYDNGPGRRIWQPFRVVCDDRLRGALGSATQQLSALEYVWNYVGPIGLRDPLRTYTVHWASAPFEPAFDAYPGVGDKLKITAVVNVEES